MSKNSRISKDFQNQLDESPMDLLMTSTAQNSEQPQKNKSKEKKVQPIKEPAKSEPKERMTVQIRQEVIERVKDAVYWTPGLTVAQLTEEALEAALAKLEKQNGEPFKKRKAELKPGRPLS